MPASGFNQGRDLPMLKILLLTLLLSGCYVEGKPDPNDANKKMLCEHTMTGEQFRFRTKDMRVTLGIGAPTIIAVTDDTGWRRTMTREQAALYKCREIR